MFLMSKTSGFFLSLDRFLRRESWFVIVEWEGDDGQLVSTMSAPFPRRRDAEQFARRFEMESPAFSTTVISGVKLDEEAEEETQLRH